MDARLALLLALNALGFALVGWDKALARARARRIPEWLLVLGPTPFGVAGTVVGMLVFRHKTRKPSFWAKVAVALVLALALALVLRAVGGPTIA